MKTSNHHKLNSFFITFFSLFIVYLLSQTKQKRIIYKQLKSEFLFINILTLLLFIIFFRVLQILHISLLLLLFSIRQCRKKIL